MVRVWEQKKHEILQAGKETALEYQQASADPPGVVARVVEEIRVTAAVIVAESDHKTPRSAKNDDLMAMTGSKRTDLRGHQVSLFGRLESTATRCYCQAIDQPDAKRLPRQMAFLE
jgi:hypothetical protein